MYLFLYFEEFDLQVLYVLIWDYLLGLLVSYGEVGLDVNYLLFELSLEKGV